MKKITSLQFLMFMSLALGSSYMMIAKESQAKQKVAQEVKPVSMKSIEHCLNKIRQDFEKSGDAAAANKALKQVEKDIKKCVSELKAKEKHGKMYEVHQHTLERKLEEVRNFVNKKSHKKVK